VILSADFLTEEDPERNEARRMFIETLSEAVEDLESFPKDLRWIVQLQNLVAHHWHHPVLESILCDDAEDTSTGTSEDVGL